MAVRKNRRGFQALGRIIKGFDVPEFAVGLKWRGADLQTMKNTILGPALSLGQDFEQVSFDLTAGTSLKASYHLSEKSNIYPLIIIIHGLAGDETSPNVISAAAYFSSLGFPVLRLNLRGAGPSAKTSAGLYHGGLSEDLAHVVDQAACRNYGAGIVLYGISLGGNMMLKYLGERGADAPVKAAIGVSAPLSLKAVQRRIMERRNKPYHNYLLLGMKNYVRGMADHHEKNLLDKAKNAKSLFEFDDQFTAPAHGMSGAEEYYNLHSAQKFIDRIKVSTLLIHAQNDPWIPAADYQDRVWSEDDAISLLLTDDGGHVGFHAKDHKVPWHERVAGHYLKGILAQEQQV
ncbi:MAG: alpha/beta fold hydrolase [Emcibacter sp.]|nr:alpha/beta fold hydrolase [Emcibacter sp.]